MYQFGYFLVRNASCYPNRDALIFKDCKLTYRELNLASNRLANSFLSLGLAKGDRVAYLYRNSVEWILIWYATQKIGVTAVPLNIQLLTPELASIVNAAECKMLLYNEEFAEKVQPMPELCSSLSIIVCQGNDIPEGQYNWDDLYHHSNADEAQVPLSGKDESIILFTSGTTGVSKGVLRTQQMVRDHALMLAIENNNSHVPEILLTHCPLFHAGGLLCLLKMAALCGTLILVDKVEPKFIMEMIERHRATQILMIPPILFQRFTRCENWPQYDLSSVREALCTGGKNSLAYAMTMFELFPNCRIRPSWGSTEICSATGAQLSKSQVLNNPNLVNSVGKLNSMVEIRLIDDKKQDVPDGTVGEAIVRSSMVFRGYLNQPEAAGQSPRDGWFHTEDLLKRDADGYYYLVDRMKDVVKTGGETVYAQEVEAVLQRHPAILDCAIVGIPDERFGEAVAAAIVLAPGQQVTAAEILTFSKQHLPSYKKPRYWAMMDQLPVNSIGKLQKSVLRENADQLFQKIAK